MATLDGDVKMEGWNSVVVQINGNSIWGSLNDGHKSRKNLKGSVNWRFDAVHLGYYNIK